MEEFNWIWRFIKAIFKWTLITGKVHIILSSQFLFSSTAVDKKLKDHKSVNHCAYLHLVVIYSQHYYALSCVCDDTVAFLTFDLL